MGLRGSKSQYTSYYQAGVPSGWRTIGVAKGPGVALGAVTNDSDTMASWLPLQVWAIVDGVNGVVGDWSMCWRRQKSSIA